MTLALAPIHTPAQPGVQTLFPVQLLTWKILIFNQSLTRALLSDAEARHPSSAAAAWRKGDFAFLPARLPSKRHLQRFSYSQIQFYEFGGMSLWVQPGTRMFIVSALFRLFGLFSDNLCVTFIPVPCNLTPGSPSLGAWLRAWTALQGLLLPTLSRGRFVVEFRPPTAIYPSQIWKSHVYIFRKNYCGQKLLGVFHLYKGSLQWPASNHFFRTEQMYMLT